MNINESAYYRIQVRHSGKYLEVPNGSMRDGEQVVQNSKNNRDDQKWKLEPVEGESGLFYIVAKHSGKCLDISNDGTYQIIIQSTKINGNDTQKWIIKAIDDPGYFLIVSNIAKNMCLDVEGAKDNDGRKVILFAIGRAIYRNMSNHRKWKFEEIEENPSVGKNLPSQAELLLDNQQFIEAVAARVKDLIFR